MQYKNVFEDFFYSTTATTLTYRIEDENGEPVFIGRAVGDSAGTRVNVAQKIRDWLFNEIGDFRESDGEFFDHPDAIHAFSLVDMSDNAVKEQWMVIYSFQPWNGDTLFLTTAINTHASPAQKLFITNGAKIDVPTHRTQDITDGGEGDGPGSVYFDAQDTVSVPYSAGTATVAVSTNIDPADISVVVPAGVVCTRKTSTAFYFTVPTNQTTTPLTFTVQYLYEGTLQDQTVIMVNAWEWEFVMTTHDVDWEGGYEAFPTYTNVDVSAITVDLPSGVTLISKGQDSWTFNFPENEHGYPIDWEFVFHYNGESKTVVIHQAVLHDVRDEYLTVTPLVDKVTLSTDPLVDNVGSFAVVWYRVNGGNWTKADIASRSGRVKVITGLSAGDTVEFKDLTVSCTTLGGFYINDIHEVYGNILSLKYGDDFSGKTDLVAQSGYSDMFYGSTVVDASLLALPSGLLCASFGDMFYGCTSLVKAPRLPAKRVVTRAVDPVSGIRITGHGSYANMFKGCTNLTVAPPELPATEVVANCYSNMFNGCTSLVTGPKYIGAVNSYMCCKAMFLNCSALKTAPELPATELGDNCYTDMFGRCTSLEDAPVLPAENLVNACYAHMFSGCTSLETVTCYAKVTANAVTNHWMDGVSATGDAYVDSSYNWETGGNGIPSGWTVHYL